ncbi:MAG TPA: DMT family transporter [Xanthobacteraceae bacterium]|nr:DMT family transporter [Xanthobacteraceae bacterium]
MIAASWLWAVFTVIASVGQTARNAMQRELTRVVGTVGATLVRFLFGLPFGILFLAGVAYWLGKPLPVPTPSFLAWDTLGAVTQIGGTALMLMAMNERSFVVTTAYLKTEPVLVALFGFVFLGDKLTLHTAFAIVVATMGVMMMSWTKGAAAASIRPLLFGVGAAALFGISAVGFRGAILSLDAPSFVMAATFALAVGLSIQTTLLCLYLALFDRKSLHAILREWRPSLFAGFMGAAGSQFWFLAFALTTAANVRTLALIEVLFAQIVSRRLFDQKSTPREIIGIVLVVAGIAFLLWTH